MCPLLYFSYLFLAVLLPCRKSLLLWGHLWLPPPCMVADRDGCHPSSWWGGSARYPQAFQIPNSRVIRGISVSLEKREEVMVRGSCLWGPWCSFLHCLCHLPCCDTTDLTLVAKVLDKNSSCSCGGNQTGRILGLTEHLKS